MTFAIDHFKTRVLVSVSPQFFGWVTGIGSGMKITGPDNVKAEYKAYLQDVLENYLSVIGEIMVEVSKRDWKLFREKLPGWQESYMERLCKEYVELLTCDKKGSERFWALEERIKKDRKAPGVILSVSKSDMLIDLVRLVQDEVIGLGDLSDFSEDVQERVKFMVQRW